MGMGFRLNLKWVSPIQSHSFTTSSCTFSSSVRGRKGSFNSARLSFLSIISEEAASYSQDGVKASTFSTAVPQNERDYSEMVEIWQNSAACVGQDTCSTSDFNLLMENLYVLESTFADSDVMRLEREILLQLGRLGALKFFNTCLSRIPKTSNVFDLSDVPTENIEKPTMNGTRNNHKEKIIIHSKRKEKRKTRIKRLSENSNKTSQASLPSKAIHKDFQRATVSFIKRESKSRSRRLVVARNEAEMSRGVKVVANLERIKTTLEEQTGQVASLSCWAEAAGVNKKVLQQYLRFGWYCRDELLKSTRSLVLFLARNYRGLGVPVSDLLQAGNFGVLQGAERFDHTRGYQFSTYVQYWIRKSMSRMVAQHARGIKIPCTLSRSINKIQKARKALNNSHGKYPEDSEIAKFTGLSPAEIRSASECLRVVGSLDQKMGDWQNAKYLEFMPDMSIKCPEEIVMRQHMKNDIYNLLNNLDSRERQVLMLRYGIKDHRPRSLEEIGRLFHVSKEWIRKIEKKAMTKLRAKETCRNISHYLDL